MLNVIESYNEVFANQLGLLESIMSKRGEPFRAKAYKKAQETIMLWPSLIKSASQLSDAPNIGTTILEKLKEYENTGKISLIEEEKNNPTNILSDVYGIGPKKAEELVKVHGVKSIQELRERSELLNDVQRVGLKYYEDILERIPRSEIGAYKQFFHSASQASSSTFEIVGSYRRGALDSGDIDVIITPSNSTPSNSTPFKAFVDHLISNHIIVEVLSRGPSKCLVIAKLNKSSCARRIDFLFTPPNEYAFAVLYFTGSKAFNTMMRQHALNMGYTLNEHCISKLDSNGNKLSISEQLLTEQSIFQFLKMEYTDPDKRTGLSHVSYPAQSNQKAVDKPKLAGAVNKNRSVSAKHRPKISFSNEPVFNIMKMVEELRKNGIDAFKKYGEPELKRLLSDANTAYHNHVPFLSDNEFDIIEQYVSTKYASSGLQIGAPVSSGNKVDLPYEMASMDKIKPDTQALESWTKTYKGPYVLSCKLDGVSGLYTTENGKVRLYTRGDGKVGQDISHLIPYLKLPRQMNICIRGEFIIPKKIFNEKYKLSFANPRNMVAGLINHKHMDNTFFNKIKDVCFVAYEVISPVLKPSEQFNLLKQLTVECCYNLSTPSITNEMLSKMLEETRERYLYEIDGVIVCDDKTYKRSSGNPAHAFAFKMVLSEQIAHAKVLGVHWSASKDGYLKPRVQIEPVTLGGVQIEFATGFNAAFIQQNKIGIGSVIELIRSGDVIPHIKRVIASTEAQMPDCEYEWNDTGIDAIVKDTQTNETVIEKTITLFFKGIEVDGLSSGGIKKLCKAGFNSISKIIKMTKEEIESIDGFGDRSARKIRDGIDIRMKSVSLVTLMASSNLFGRGFGELKIAPIMELHPNILVLKESKEEKIKKVLQAKGVAHKSAEAFVNSIEAFNAFLKEISWASAVPPSPSIAESTTLHPLFKKTIVFTGFRDKKLSEELKKVGAIVGASVTKNTFMVVAKSAEEASDKTENAAKLGIPLALVEDFINKYFAVY